MSILPSAQLKIQTFPCHITKELSDNGHSKIYFTCPSEQCLGLYKRNQIKGILKEALEKVEKIYWSGRKKEKVVYGEWPQRWLGKGENESWWDDEEEKNGMVDENFDEGLKKVTIKYLKGSFYDENDRMI